MTNNNKKFCFASGYTENLLTVKEFKLYENSVTMTFQTPLQNQFLFSGHTYFNGVICQIINYDSKTFSVSTAKDLAVASTIFPLYKGKKLSFGKLLADAPLDEQDYPLHPTTALQVRLTEKPSWQGDTIKLKFKCAKDQDGVREKVFREIAKKDQPYAGIEGSSLFLHDIKQGKRHIKFSVSIWHNTQQKTKLNEHLEVGTELSFNYPRYIR